MTSGERIRPKKSLGQHFLTDPEVAQRIAGAVDAGPEDLVVEVGPGHGALTGFLLRRSGRVVGIELDRDLARVLSSRFSGDEGFHLINADALRVDLAALVRRHGARDALVVGNLPYNVATPLILSFLECPSVRRAVVTVQREVALRIVASPGGKPYGSLTVAVQVRGTPRRLFDVPAAAFTPVPRVASTVIDIDTRHPARPVAEGVRKTFFEVVRWTFGHRRKMLRGTLRSLPGRALGPGALSAVERRSALDLRRRPETLDIGEFERLAWAVQEAAQSVKEGA